ncbi:cupin domain-containing protein [Nonomuraea sp. NPDC049714]|jgi:quercetin dioxygenase-like cupin family protein|uniref:cupin domain-containing protein n=1 Tax=Nonomuraea sp. NPDC049714 TaxID=3364357 RepID=UPI003793F4F2
MALNLPLPPKDDPVWTAANGFVVRKDGGVIRLTGHETMAVKVTGEQTDGAFAFMDGIIEPGHGNQAHIHSKEDEAFYVVSGEFSFINGNQKITAGIGDFVYIPKGTRHGFKNISAEPARLLVFYTPAGPEAFFLAYGETDRAPEPWPDEKFNELVDILGAHNMVLLPGDHDWD